LHLDEGEGVGVEGAKTRALLIDGVSSLQHASEKHELFRLVELAQVAQVVLTNEPCSAVLHRRHVGVVYGDWRISTSRIGPRVMAWERVLQLGRNAASRGVKRKSAGGSNFVNICLAMGGLKAKRKRNAPLTDEGIYPPVGNPICHPGSDKNGRRLCLTLT
jgi:hypothetical protein